VFHPLAKDQIKAIAKIQISQIADRLADREITLSLTEEAMNAIADAGFDPVFGARPLKRVIQQRLENPMAQKILSGNYGPGDKINVDCQDGNFILTK